MAALMGFRDMTRTRRPCDTIPLGHAGLATMPQEARTMSQQAEMTASTLVRVSERKSWPMEVLRRKMTNLRPMLAAFSKGLPQGHRPKRAHGHTVGIQPCKGVFTGQGQDQPAETEKNLATLTAHWPMVDADLATLEVPVTEILDVVRTFTNPIFIKL